MKRRQRRHAPLAIRAVAALFAATLLSCGGGDDGVDNTSPPEPSAAREQASAVTPPPSFFPDIPIPADADARGMWSPVYNWPGIAVHAVVLPDGRLLTFGSTGSGYQTANASYDVWDPTVAPNAGHLTLPNGTGVDIFCSSTVLLPPESPGGVSTAFIAGGDLWTGTQTLNQGNQNSAVFDVASRSLTRKSDMLRTRWYSTSVTLPNGETYIQGGSGGQDRPEVRSLTGAFRLLSSADTSALQPLYPRNFVAPDGRVFGFDGDGRMYYVNPSGNGSIDRVGQFSAQYARDSGSAALFRPGRILQIGGNSSGAIVIDIAGGGNPAVSPTQSLSSQRQWVSATILADGKVLATGGSQVDNELVGVNTRAEVWDPTTGQWMQGPLGVRPHLYHSNAILLPDASVLTTGGGALNPDVQSFNQLNAEIYYPPYFFAPGGQRASRPIIASAPDWVEVGSVLPVSVENASSISRVTLVKTGSATHSFNMDQRFLELTYNANGTNLSVQAPTRAADATPGYYMLFVFNQSGVPSIAKIVRLGISSVPNPATVPTLSNPGAQTSEVGASVSLAVSASDPNGDALSYTAAGLPPGLSIGATSGVISGSPSAPGQYNVVVTISDGINIASANFVWNVNAVNGVVINPLPPVSSAQVGEATTFTASTTGGTDVRYRWNFGDGTGDTPWSTSATIEHTFASPGTYSITFSATDSSGIVRSRSFLQTVYLPLTANKPGVSGNILVQTPADSSPRIWVVNQDNDSVTAFDAVTFAKQAEIGVGSEPRALARAPNGLIWVTNKRSDSISIVDPATNTLAGTIALPRASRPFGIVMSPASALAFVVLEATGQVMKLDAQTRAPLGSASVGPNPRHVSIGADGTRLYVSRFITPPLPGEGTTAIATSAGTGGEVVVLEAATLGIVRTIVLQHSEKADLENQGRGIPNYLGAAAISPDGSQAWVPGKQDNVKRGGRRDGNALNFQNTVRAISSRIVLGTQQEDLARRIDHDNASVASAAVYDARGVYLFVALETSREVAVVDAHGGFQVMRFAVGRAPQGLVLSADGKTLYVNNFMDRTVGVYDLRPLLEGGQLSVPAVVSLIAVGSERLAPNVLLGKQHFYDARDTRLALDRYMSCASCHNDGGSDGRTWDFSSLGEGLRNTISLRGRAGAQGLQHWSGNFDEVQDFEAQIRTLAGGTGLMSNISFNAGTRSQPLGDPKTGVSGDLDALAAYVGSLNSVDPSPQRDAAGQLTAAGTAGRTVFLGQACAACHGGTAFTNATQMGPQNVGTLKPSSGSRSGSALTGIDIPTLRDVWQTGPYLHDGSAPTLEAAIQAHSGVTIGSSDLASLTQYLREIGSDEPTAPGIQNNGLVTGLAFNEGSGPSSLDLSGNGHAGTLLNGTAWAAGNFGGAVSLDGVNDVVSVANPATLDFGTSNFTAMMWIKRNALGGSMQRHLLSKCASAAWEIGCKELYFQGNVLRYGTHATGDTNSVTIADTNWHHIALVFTRATNAMQIYVDGTLRTSATKNLEADGPAHVVQIGNQQNNNPFSGLIDEVRIYSRALTAAQVVTEMNTALAAPSDTSAPVLGNAQPSGTLPAGTTQATLSLTSNENATCRHATAAGTAYASMPNAFATTGGTSHSTVVSGLANGQSYTRYVRCQDTAGNANTSDLVISFSVAAPDTIAPTVGITSPAAGATVSGTINVTASASDNVGVVGVQFLLGGANLGAEVTAPPYTVGWTTASVGNGPHALSARARDAAGNQTLSAPVNVTVLNADTVAPTVSVTAPAAGATVSGTVSVSANAADNVGVAGVQFLLDGANLGAEVTTPPYTASWNTVSTTNGAHSITARARDAAGNQTLSAAVGVTVSNGASIPPDAAALGFNEGIGTSSADLSGNGHGATLVNGAAWAAGKYGSAVSFDGVNDAVSVGNPATLDFGASNFTAMMWVKRNALGGSVQRHLLSKCASAAWEIGCKELYFQGDVLRYGTHATGDTNSVTIADTNWHHIALVFTRATNAMQIYVDGTLRTSATKNLEADGPAHVVQIGNQQNNNPFSGLIDEVRIYSRALTAAQVVTEMNTALAAPSDTSAPVLGNAQPSGTLPAGTTQATLSLTSNENATCRHATAAGTAYASMPNAFATTGGTSHSTVVSGLANGQSYTRYVRCQDTAGNANTSDLVISFSVAAPDTIAPTVGITSPAAGATVSGTINVTASASDNVGVVGVQFLLGGANLGAEVTAPPYTVGWTTASVGNGPHALSARARDAAGNQTLSAPVNVTVLNADTVAPTVSVTAPAAGATVSGTVSVSANAADNVGVAGVQFLLDGANLGAEVTTPPYTASWNTVSTTNGAHSITARARDAAGNPATSGAIAVTVSNADTTAPTVTVSAPSAGATVSGSVAISANAADNVGVAGVQFLLDGANLGTEVTTPPYTFSWNTASTANGAHSITARARDAAGNQTVSAAIGVTVSNAAGTAPAAAAFGFTEGAGTTSADLSGNGHTATLVNGPVWTVGWSGNAISFDGLNDFVTVFNSSTLNFGSADFTIMMWIKRNALGGGTGKQRHLLSKCLATGTKWELGCKELYFAGNVLRFGSYASSDVNSVTIADTNWHHIAVVFTRETNTLQFYVDGTLRTTATRNLEADGTSHAVVIGNMQSSHAFSGLIDEVRLHAQALTAAQVVSGMNAAAP